MKIVDGLLPNHLVDSLLSIAEGVAFNRGGSSNNYKVWTNLSWNEGVVRNSSPIICIATPDNLLLEIQDCLIRNGMIDLDLNVPITETKSVTIYIGTKDSYIPPHNDNTHGKAISIYLNRSWRLSDGGLFCWKDGEGIRCIEPRLNVAVENTSHELHFTTPVTTREYPRISLQIFIANRQ
jgi:hypothetical protein